MLELVSQAWGEKKDAHGKPFRMFLTADLGRRAAVSGAVTECSFFSPSGSPDLPVDDVIDKLERATNVDALNLNLEEGWFNKLIQVVDEFCPPFSFSQDEFVMAFCVLRQLYDVVKKLTVQVKVDFVDLVPAEAQNLEEKLKLYVTKAEFDNLRSHLAKMESHIAGGIRNTAENLKDVANGLAEQISNTFKDSKSTMISIATANANRELADRDFNTQIILVDYSTAESRLKESRTSMAADLSSFKPVFGDIAIRGLRKGASEHGGGASGDVFSHHFHDHEP
eukprot:Sspe_Gene.3688::Locus_1229_Transcript_1_1_Confidence_1.000_Length_6310::g.3688::m.3688